ncbi:hypothetical protein HFO04_01015 [Rhizobium laguerreae]|uniref:hypothetical protein n=1 Tax=Rhizobium laguerreae TaxID=1076926 RepID=UPI001C910FE5|nr:hypothetical protein [Rhizobium laguerreae]MBY3301393.1 hypothetical protein [Rhizobium laguerreae]
MALPPHAQDWMRKAEIDYIGPFVKAWAAFNAWYRHDSGQANERAMLDWAIRHNNSRLRRHVLPLLSNANGTAEAEGLKLAVSDLQQKLDAIQFEVTIKGRIERVSLREVCIAPLLNWQGDQIERSSQRYMATKIQGGHYEIKVVSVRTGATKFQHVQVQYDANSVYGHPDFANALTLAQQTALRQFYDACNPRPMTDLVLGGGPVLHISTMQFQCTATDLLAGLVETLYSMRNALLHGEVDPDPQILACYEPAYRIVMAFLTRVA